MKVIAAFVFAAVISVTAASAKTVTTSQGNANDQSVVGVAGPAPSPNKPDQAMRASSGQPSKKALKKSRIKPPPPLHDPN